jgi:hypothetical protein
MDNTMLHGLGFEACKEKSGSRVVDEPEVLELFSCFFFQGL